MQCQPPLCQEEVKGVALGWAFSIWTPDLLSTLFVSWDSIRVPKGLLSARYLRVGGSEVRPSLLLGHCSSGCVLGGQPVVTVPYSPPS